MAHLLFLFSVTFAAAFAASALPGLLNMNAAKTSVEKGKRSGVVFSCGVSSTIMMQACVAVLLSRFIYENPEVIDILLKVALGVFALLSVYFFIAARRKKTVKQPTVKISHSNNFFKGVLLAILNLLTIPYYSALTAGWHEAGWMVFRASDIIAFVSAAGAGTFSILYLYVFFFNRLETKTRRFSKNANYILGGLLLVLCIIIFMRILYR